VVSAGRCAWPPVVDLTRRSPEVLATKVCVQQPHRPAKDDTIELASRDSWHDVGHLTRPKRRVRIRTLDSVATSESNGRDLAQMKNGRPEQIGVSRESGEGEIRTPEDPKALLVFETSPFNRSGTSPAEDGLLSRRGGESNPDGQPSLAQFRRGAGVAGVGACQGGFGRSASPRKVCEVH
jgi:hypothetical protein